MGLSRNQHHYVHAHCVNGGLGHDHELHPKLADDQDAVDVVTRQRDTITRTAADTEVLLPYAWDSDQASTAAPPDDDRDLFGREGVFAQVGWPHFAVLNCCESPSGRSHDRTRLPCFYVELRASTTRAKIAIYVASTRLLDQDGRSVCHSPLCSTVRSRGPRRTSRRAFDPRLRNV